MSRSGKHVGARSLVVAALVVIALAAPAGGAEPRPRGLAKPTPASGIGTSAAMDSERCHTGDGYGIYGQLDGTRVGQGPICVRPWSAGDDNGGATARGVTGDAVRVVVVTPLPSQAVGSATPTNRATGAPGTYEDAIHDYLEAAMRVYETWGRDIDVRFVQSSGSDEAAQRADALAIEEMDPFAVIDAVGEGLPILDAELANAGIVVRGTATTTAQALAQPGFRWGTTDVQATAVNAAGFAGKQLAGRKARFGGDDTDGAPRRFGLVYADGLLDPKLVERILRRAGDVGFAGVASYRAPGSILGDATSAQEQAPVIVQRMKDAGVTTVVLVTDRAMTGALMEQATQQEYFPEWFFTGSLFADLPLFARSYPADQMAHAFGLTQGLPPLPPTYEGKPSVGVEGPLNWYWGPTSATSETSAFAEVEWLLGGIHAAGPRLTPATFERGWFSTPPRAGAEVIDGLVTAYGGAAGLPYDSYFQYGSDYSTFWWDPDLETLSWGIETVAEGNMWFPNDAARYTLGSVPSAPIRFFSPDDAIHLFEDLPPLSPVAPCTGCPSQGGPGTPGAPSAERFVVPNVELGGAA